jgi:hypothetical protein
MKTNVRSYTDRELLDRTKSLPTFRGFPTGYFVIYVRSNEDAYDSFDDKKYTYYFEEGMSTPRFIRVDTCTTNTGSYGLLKFSNYTKADGAAILQGDHMVYDAFVRGKSKGRNAYRENKAWGHYRDGNKDKKVDTVGDVIYEKIYAHIHRTKSRYNIINKIYNQSVGCLVDNNIEAFEEWFKMLDGQKYLTAVILNEF